MYFHVGGSYNKLIIQHHSSPFCIPVSDPFTTTSKQSRSNELIFEMQSAEISPLLGSMLNQVFP